VPTPQSGNLFFRKHSWIEEFHVPHLRVPGRHKLRFRHFSNLPGAFAHILIREQRKRPDLARAMARSAILEDDWRDVLGERRRVARRSAPEARLAKEAASRAKAIANDEPTLEAPELRDKGFAFVNSDFIQIPDLDLYILPFFAS
jgi:hypothetical protein